MSKVTIKLNKSGVAELLKCEDIARACDEAGQKVLAKAKGEYEVDTQIHTRAVTRVSTTTKDGYFRELANNTLLKALK